MYTLNSFRNSVANRMIISYKKIRKNSLLLLMAIVVLVTSSCRTSSKGITYFSDLTDAAQTKLPDIDRPEHLIEADDILDIKVGGANEVTAASFNLYTSGGGAAATTSIGYLVDKNGEIEFPRIGKIKLAGLTREQAKIKITKEIDKYLQQPLVNVRFVNFRFTVLGEVRVPGSFTLANEKVTILDALGYAGDMTANAKRDLVRVIRDSAGKREIGTVNFNQKTIFTSPYYYLHRNDVIYIEPQKNKAKLDDAGRFTAVLSAMISVVTVVLSFVIKR
jgi:polysaccharide export outer membrane protein